MWLCQLPGRRYAGVRRARLSRENDREHLCRPPGLALGDVGLDARGSPPPVTAVDNVVSAVVSGTIYADEVPRRRTRNGPEVA